MSADASKPKSLFIGGPRDGDWIRAGGLPTVGVYETTERGAKESRYRGERFVIGRFQEIIYIHESIALEEGFEKLLKGYKP